VELNVDLGELPGEPGELYALAHVANIACGGHAGDAKTLREALGLCHLYGARPGAHPSYPDRAGFGRTRMVLSTEALRATVREQCSLLAAEAVALGLRVASVKAHGALYHDATDDRAIADALILGATDALGTRFTLIGPARGSLPAAARDAGLIYAREGFADRAVLPDGTLVPRGQPGALIVDPSAAATRARELLAASGIETICVHGDTQGAVAIARAVRAVLDSGA
jgi:UPF0271 protein